MAISGTSRALFQITTMAAHRDFSATNTEEFDRLLGDFAPTSSLLKGKDPSSASEVNMVCSTCDNAIALPAQYAEEPLYKSHCTLCDQPFSIEMIYASDDMSVIELKGCEYGRPQPLAAIGTLIESEPASSLMESEATKVGDNPFATDDKSFVDSLLAHWEVRTKAGEVFHFEYFSAIRKWISEGKLKAGDEIIPADGRHYRLETYPGTADLFGNIFLRNEARSGMAERVRVASPKAPKRKIVWTHVFVTLALAALVGVAPDVVQSIRIRTGEKLIHRLVQLETPVAPERYLTEVLNANDRFRKGTPEDLRLAEKSYLRALALKPNDPEVIGGLVETWVELSDSTSPILSTGRALLRYAQARFPNNNYILRASARLEHKQGENSAALRKLDQALRNDPNNPDTHALIAMIAMDEGDFTTATLHLDQSLQLDPTNGTLVNAFVTLFERQSKFSEAAEYLKRMAQLSGDPSRNVERLAELYLKANDSSAAEAVYRDAIRRGTSAEHFRAELIQFLSKQNRTDDVVQESLAFLRLYPNGEYSSQVRATYVSALDSMSMSSGKSAENDGQSKSEHRSGHRSNLSRRR